MADAHAKPGDEWATPLVKQVAAAAAVHLVLVTLLLDLRVEHVALDAALVALAAWPRSRTFARLVFPVWCVGAVYELIQLAQPLRPPVDVADLYHAELALFSMDTASGPEVLPIALQATPIPALDVIAGLAYILYMYVPLALAALLWWRGYRNEGKAVVWSFFLVSVIGFVIQMIYPAAPPWYVVEHGLGPAVMDAAPSAAGAARFDAITGLAYFEHFYSRNANVFGAMPSLHTAIPIATTVCVTKLGARWSVPTWAFALTVACSAVYLNHHYILDVVGGAVLGVAGGWLVLRQLLRGSEPNPGQPELHGDVQTEALVSEKGVSRA